MAEQRPIRVEYYALLREERGQPEDLIMTTAANARELYEELQARFHFSLPWQRLGVAVNDEFQRWDTTLNANDKVVFIPPVAGG